jgi:2-polyprenyl-3-methyl-5-hydroxy-6-metoxy-1,4-benzoquinol methylase
VSRREEPKPGSNPQRLALPGRRTSRAPSPPQGTARLRLEAHSREGGSDPWRSFWEATPAKQEIVRAEASDYVSRLSTVVPLVAEMRVLDFGCGTGHIAERLARQVSEVAVWDASQAVQARTHARLSDNRRVSIVDLSDERGVRASGQFDLIISHSVVQYMGYEELGQWLSTWSSMLKPRGSIVISDIVSDNRGVLRELWDLAAFASRNRVLLGALRDEYATALTYTRAMGRARARLLVLTQADIITLAVRAELNPTMLPGNLGHKTGRLAVRLTRSSAE